MRKRADIETATGMLYALRPPHEARYNALCRALAQQLLAEGVPAAEMPAETVSELADGGLMITISLPDGARVTLSVPTGGWRIPADPDLH